MLVRLSLLGTCYRCSWMFTSFCCRGPQSSTMTRTATSQHAVCYDCNLTTPPSPGVFMPLFLSSGLLPELMDTNTSLCSIYNCIFIRWSCEDDPHLLNITIIQMKKKIMCFLCHYYGLRIL